MAPAYASDLSTWLVRHHLSYGIAEYPQANTVTLDSGGQVQMLDPQWPGGVPVPGDYQTKLSWYDAHRHDANFVVAMHPPDGNRSGIYRLARAAFGPPARTYNFGDYTVMTWNKNLLTYFGPPPTAPRRPEPRRPLDQVAVIIRLHFPDSFWLIGRVLLRSRTMRWTRR